MVKTKISGERGQPWRVPLAMEKASDSRPLTLILAVGDEYKASIIWSKRVGSPRVFNVADM